MKKFSFVIAAIAAMALAVPAFAQKVEDPTPNGQFTDSQGNKGYVEVYGDGVRACNENEATPAGDSFTGYAWVDASGDGYVTTDDDAAAEPSYGNGHIGAGDADGEGVDDGDDVQRDADGNVTGDGVATEGDDCP